MFAAIFGVLISRCKAPAEENNESDTVAIADTVIINTDRKDEGTSMPETSSKELSKEALRTPLTLTITNLKSSTAPIIMGVYSTKNKFPDPKDKFKEYKFKPNGKTLVVKITNLKFGMYAMAIYQDENSNGEIDKNMLGIPTERYGFSNNYKPMVRAPRFHECKFEYSAEANTQSIKLVK